MSRRHGFVSARSISAGGLANQTPCWQKCLAGVLPSGDLQGVLRLCRNLVETACNSPGEVPSLDRPGAATNVFTPAWIDTYISKDSRSQRFRLSGQLKRVEPAFSVLRQRRNQKQPRLGTL